MTVWRAAVVLCMAAAVAAAPAVQSGAAASRPSCEREGDEVMVRGERVTVYASQKNSTTACDRRTGRRVQLSSEETTRIGPIWVTGPYVLYQEESEIGLDFAQGLCLQDVRRPVPRGIAGTPDGTNARGSYTRDAVVDEDGNVAAIISDGDPFRVIRCRYRDCTSQSHVRAEPFEVIDNGQIEPRSLVRRGNRVSWRTATGQRSMTLGERRR